MSDDKTPQQIVDEFFGTDDLHRRHIAQRGEADIHLVITINGREYYNVPLEEWWELEDSGGVHGIWFIRRDDEDENE